MGRADERGAEQPSAPEERAGSVTPRDPRSPRRRRLWIGCGSWAVIFVIGVWVLIKDDPPHDDSDLHLSIPAPVSGEESVIGELLEIHAMLPEPRDWHEDALSDSDLDPWDPRPLVRSEWETPEQLEEMQEYHEGYTDDLDRVAVALEGPDLGWAVLVNIDDVVPGIMELRDVAEHLQARALWRRAAGDTVSASRDLESVRTLGERLVGEGSYSLIQGLVGVSIYGMGMRSIESLLHDGVLDPEVEARIISREPVFDRDPEIVKRCIQSEYRAMRSTLEQLSGGGGFGARGGSPALGIPFGFKKHRTIARIAVYFRAMVAEFDRPPPLRQWPDPASDSPGSVARRALLHLNTGEMLIPLILPNIARAVEKFDRFRLDGRALRLLVSIVAYDRAHGVLPPDLEALVAGTDGLDAIPLDLYSDAPFRYDPERRIFWSMGTDGVDGNAVGWNELRDDPVVSRDDLPDLIWIIP